MRKPATILIALALVLGGAACGDDATDEGAASALGIESITSVGVEVRDFGAMVAWYRDVLGLEVTSREEDYAVLQLPGGGAAITINSGRPERLAKGAGGGWEPDFAVADLDATVALLKDAGVRMDPEEGEGEGYREVRIYDPEGNPIGLSPADEAD